MFSSWLPAGSQSSCRAVMPALVARQWDGKVWKKERYWMRLNGAALLGRMCQSRRVRWRMAANSHSRIAARPISQELCHNRPALFLLADTHFCSWTLWTPPLFILHPSLYQLTDIVIVIANRQNFAFLNTTASITIVWWKLASITKHDAVFSYLIYWNEYL